MLSARSEEALHDLVAAWRGREATPARLRAAARNRDHHPHRLVALDPATLDEAIAGTALRDGALAFVFSGNGAQ